MSSESLNDRPSYNAKVVILKINQQAHLPGGGWWTLRCIDSRGAEVDEYTEGCRLFLGIEGNSFVGNDLAALAFTETEGDIAECTAKALAILDDFGFVYSGSVWRGERVFVEKS